MKANELLLEIRKIVREEIAMAIGNSSSIKKPIENKIPRKRTTNSKEINEKLQKIKGMQHHITMEPEDDEEITPVNETQKTVLKNFGGFMTIDEFRNYGLLKSTDKKKKKLDHNIQISTEHISYINQEILETYIESSC